MNKVQLILLIITFIFSSCGVEKSMIKKAREKNTIEGYKAYIETYKDGKYSKEANQKIEEIRFNQLRDSVFNSFINILDNKTNNLCHITITPSNEILMGTPISIEITGLKPKTEIILHAYRRCWSGVLYSFASFYANEKGIVDIRKADPICGTYDGVDPLGIFWSMSWPAQRDLKFPFEVKELKNDVIFFKVELENNIIGSNELTLIDKKSNIISEIINNNTLTAIFHYPENTNNLPVVVLLSGSEGGYQNINKMAKIISSNGYAVLALAYFKIDPLPEHLEKIPLEYFYGVLDWLKSKSNLDKSKIIIAGGSRGGELGLLLASKRKDICGVIAVEPSCVLWQGLPHSPGSMLFPKPAWTENGDALPYLKHRLHLPTMAKFGTNAKQIELMKLYEGRLDNKKKIQDAFIEVENINGPILLISGKDGKLWPSFEMCQMMEKRLTQKNFKYAVETLYYDHAGHYVTIAPDYSPTIGYKYDQLKVGGTDSGNAAAQLDSWNQMIDFLQRHFPVDD